MRGQLKLPAYSPAGQLLEADQDVGWGLQAPTRKRPVTVRMLGTSEPPHPRFLAVARNDICS